MSQNPDIASSILSMALVGLGALVVGVIALVLICALFNGLMKAFFPQTWERDQTRVPYFVDHINNFSGNYSTMPDPSILGLPEKTWTEESYADSVFFPETKDPVVEASEAPTVVMPPKRNSLISRFG